VLRYLLPMLLAAVPCFAQEAAPKNEVARMDEIVRSYVADKQFMGTVLVARGDKILLDKGYGSANLEWDIANAPTTKFRLGSITKQFTAAAILLLEEQGKLKVEDPVKKYLPDAPAAWDKITIFNLLTHTSGIPNFTSFPEYKTIEPFAKTSAELLKLFIDKPLEFPPGEKWNYSNSGYIALGCIVEKVSGESYAKFVQDHIFAPLGMKDSGYDSHATIIERRAAGYSHSEHGIVNAGYIDMSIPFSAGALYSTSEDLLRWEQGLFGGKLLTAASLAKMTTPFKDNYAFGLEVRDIPGGKKISHGGGIEGFNTMMIHVPEKKLTVIALSNLNGAAPDRIADHLVSVAFGEKVVLPSERKTINVPAPVLAEYAGTYRLRPGFDLVVTLEGSQLMTQATGQSKLPVFAESETKFFPKVVDAQIEFVRGKDGKVDHLILHQGGRDTEAPRVSSQP
jgi:CubicO group peptidase (beta-lactamase class C family)